ncbi:MAG: C39 family peptidase [Aquamicrobium sp.]|uniref:C39 family peptidase n=1 Tax=Mesorhizobium sp. Pch-S TaxID=2082387 RepID=UPI001A90DC61|nr:C39 family peptidase [Mesorhizobium sp. Pch-S]MBR2686395.1 C39 family peptidase [Aquamicrobium sp.]
MAKLAECDFHTLRLATGADCSTSHRLRPSGTKAGIASLFLGTALAMCVQLPTASAQNALGNSTPVSALPTYAKTNDIPPRLQWEANYGYCGEVSLISAGLYYGQYVSQYDARAIASKNANQSTEGSQLLLGVNDSYAAAQMHLNAIAWKNTSTSNTTNFLAWVKENVASGYPVVIGVYYNQRSFDVSNDPNAGDNEYDHIVPVTGVSSKHPLAKSATYYADDELTFSDNGLYTPNGKPTYVYKYPFGAFQATRREANSKAHPDYSLARGGSNYGIAITGIIDRDGQTLPVRLSTNVNYEKPAMREGSNTRPASQNLTLTITVSGLQPGVSYNLYRYNSFQSVPNSAFNAAASKASRKWKINIKSGTSATMTEKIKSDEIAVYRAVPETAP